MKWHFWKQQLLFALTLLILTTPLEGASSKFTRLNSNNDHGLWLEESIYKPLNEDWTITFFTNQRWGSDYKLFWFYEFEPMLQYSLKKRIEKWFCLSSDSIFKDCTVGTGFAQYNHIKKNTEDKTKWGWVFRPIIETHISLEWRSWQFKHRLRGEYQNHLSSHYKKYGNGRYRIIINPPWKFTRMKISPYISNEWFFRANTYHKTHPQGLVGGLYEDRFRIGLNASMWNDQFTPSIYWQWRPIKQLPTTHPRWFNTYQYGVILKFNF